jgi:hypothetical protein
MIEQLLLWVDGVGGYRVCLAGRVRIGQAVPGTDVEAPVLADIGRHHATLLRDDEGYVLEAIKKTQVNGQPIDKAVLRDGDRLTLGSACQFQLGLPVAMSATAKLHLVSGHRFPKGVDAVFLLADSLVLGPDPEVHVEIADLDQLVHLYRCGGQLGIHAAGAFSIDGRPCRDRGVLEPASVVRG